MGELYWHKAASSKLFSSVFGQMKARQAKRKESRGPQRLANLAVAALLAAALAGVWVLRLPEPVYQGIPLSAWVEDLGDNPYAAGKALREIGRASCRERV